MKNSVSAVVEDLLKAWNARDKKRILSFYAGDYLGEESSDPLPQYGKEGLSAMIDKFFAAFPDLQIEMNDILYETPRTVIFWTATGTHQGRIMNIPPTGKMVLIKGVSLLRIEEGLVVSGTHFWDLAAMLRSFGLLPRLPENTSSPQPSRG